jgi:hypothetical protein
VLFAHELLGDLNRADKRFGEAEVHYRLCLDLCAERKTRSGTSGCCDLSLAELLIEAGRVDRYEEVSELLANEELLAELRFNNQLFRYEVARARLAPTRLAA